MKDKECKTGFIYDDQYLKHILEPGHPESPERLFAILSKLKSTGMMQDLKVMKPTKTPDKYIHMIHSREHLELIEKMAFKPAICYQAVSGVLTAVNKVMKGKIKNAFCAVRPPGHHVENNGEFGFCFLANVAIAAKYAQVKHKLKRILIVDWDYHHGNGTEAIFYDDPSVLLFSTHKLMTFPMTGFPDRIGEGDGLGYNINIPLPEQAKDYDILQAFEDQLLKKAEQFKPELILISAGFDSRKEDYLGDFCISDQGFANLTKMLNSLAKQYCDSRIVSVLEGGYNPEGLALAVEAHLKVLMED